MICEHCGTPVGKIVARGGLRVSTKPPAATWHGRMLHGLTPVMTRMLSLLASREQVSHEAFYMLCLRDDATAKAIHVHICQLRKVLPAGLKIISISGFGYRLEMEEDMTDEPASSVATRTSTAAQELPDDTQAAVLLAVAANGDLKVTAIGTSPAGAMRILNTGGNVLIDGAAKSAQPAA